MRRRVVVATMWNGTRLLRRLGVEEPDPSAEELDVIARELLTTDDGKQDGVLPVVRVLEARVTRESEATA
jgi:hypothetical protein